MTVLILIIVLGLLIFVHEAGHFFVAKKSGMKVEEFGFGFPPRIFGIKKKETIYSINWIPFGGFVKILGEDGGSSDPGSFSSKGLFSRALVLVAGVTMNVIFAMFLLAIVNVGGLRIGLVSGPADSATDVRIHIVQVAADSPAAEIGLLTLDSIVSLSNGAQEVFVEEVEDVQKFIDENRGREITMGIMRGDELTLKTIVPRVDPPPGQGATGITLIKTGVVTYPWYEAIWRGAYDGARMTIATAHGYASIIKNLVVNGSPGVEISGPVGIAVLTGQATKTGFNYLLQFIAIISINLAIINIIPFPALDGGRLLFLLIERIKGSPVNKKIEGWINAVGFVALILLMVLITAKDIVRFF